MLGPTTAKISLLLDPNFINFFNTLITILLYAPFQPACTEAIIFFFCLKLTQGHSQP